VRGRIPEPISAERGAELREIVAALSWRAATSERYKDQPHQYTVRRPETEAAFVTLHQAIKAHGVSERYEFGGKANYYRYLYLNGWRYWAMASLPFSRVLNRAKINPG
jgi:hypothetical protein